MLRCFKKKNIQLWKFIFSVPFFGNNTKIMVIYVHILERTVPKKKEKGKEKKNYP